MPKSVVIVILASIALQVLQASPLVQADITCHDFSIPTETQTVVAALPNDPDGLDGGWPEPSEVNAGDGARCDQERTTPGRVSLGDELGESRSGEA